MRKYYLHDGISQQGPFNLYELKTKNITADTHVWCETFKDWTPAGQVEELKGLFSFVPPPFKTPPQFNKSSPYEYTAFHAERTSNKKPLFIGGAIVAVTILTIIFFTTSNNEAANTTLVASSQISSDTAVVAPTTTVDPDKIRLQQLEEKEKQRQAANAALTKKYMEYRNNWRKYVDYSTNSYRVDSWGGIYDLEVYASNKTDKLIDEIVITIDYYKTNGDLYTTKDISLTNIQPNSHTSASVPNTSRGTRIEARISKITARSFHFCYSSDYEGHINTGISGNEKDPWFCK